MLNFLNKWQFIFSILYENEIIFRMPTGVLEIRKNINPNIADALLMSGVIHCIPFLVKWSHNECELHILFAMCNIKN